MTGARAWSACGALLFGLGMSCAPSWAAAPSASGLAALPAATATDACRMQRGAFLSARLRGAATLDVAWHGVALHCDGGARPDGRGMRVSFSGKDHAHRLVFIFGIDAAPRAGRAHNVATNVTVIFEGERRVYSTRGDDRCTLDALSTRPLSVQAGERRLAVRARGFCISPASALGSGAPLLVSRFDFSGAIFLDADASAGASPPTAHGRKQPAGH
jgi:ketosteroid isomerase-like protein